MPLELFKYAHVRHLRDTLAANLDRYGGRKPWPGQASKGSDPIHLPSRLEPAVPLVLELPAGEDKGDLENAKRVYAAFPGLTAVQARDPRLWTRLTHVECWDYMRKRWDDVTRSDWDDAKKQRYVLEHYFVKGNSSRALLHNGVARLWWYAHLTRDPARADPFELTAVLLSSLDTAQQVLERNFGRAPPVRAAFLDFLSTARDRLGKSAGQRRASIRRLAKALNLRGGVTLLDCLDVGEITALLDEELPPAPAG